MKQLIQFIFICTLLFSCNKQKEVVEQKHADGSPKVVSLYENKRLIKQTKHYDNGQIEIMGTFNQEGKREGHWQYWYKNGKPWSECDYKDGKAHGNNIVYYESGAKRFQGIYEKGKKIGKWTFWDEKGEIVKEQEF